MISGAERSSAVVLVLISALLTAGDGRADPPENPVEPPAGADRAASAESAAPVLWKTATRPTTAVAKLTEKLDPANDGWSTEVLNAAASDQLAVLQRALESGEPIAAASLEPVVSGDFVCSKLRPAPLATVFDDGTLVVRRWRPSSPGPAPVASEVGPPALARALNDLRASLGPGTDSVRARLKVIQIEESEAFFTTRIVIEASRFFTGEGRQATASWRGRWDYPSAGSPPRLRALDLESHEEVAIRGAKLFADVTASTLGHNAAYRQQVLPGIGHWLDRITRISGASLFGHHGLALGDVDGDGLEDLYVCETGGLPNRLYVQNPDGTATDRSAEAGVAWLESTASALLVDLDNDGDQDLVAAAQRMLLVAENDGRGRFTLRRSLRRVVTQATSLSAADYDGDGDLDLYLCGYDGDPENRGLPGPVPYHDANNGGANVLLRNDGELRLVDVTAEVGLDAGNSRYSFAASWEDYDDDGDPDLYVANDFGRNNLYRNLGVVDGRHRFEDVAPSAGVEDVASGMSVSWGDPNRDGRMDVYVGNMFSSAGNRVAYQRAFTEATGGAAADLQRMARGNTLFSQTADGGFDDVSEAFGVTRGLWAWSSRFADLDNDGWQDLVVANGYVSNEDSGDL